MADFSEFLNIFNTHENKALRKRNYSKRWLRGIKSKTVREMQMNQRLSSLCFPTTSSWASKPCRVNPCMICEIISHYSNTRSSFTGNSYGILGNIDCSACNAIYSYQCRLCDKQ